MRRNSDSADCDASSVNSANSALGSKRWPSLMSARPIAGGDNMKSTPPASMAFLGMSAKAASTGSSAKVTPPAS